ncbi:unnamed protein product [Eruca vesicaria subsp. sativa]|uniref:Uncharacterized protein n=1 Tax=Eruca vesicaria subsp. sativa TaxID=29727 RepID=A0ABC8KA81_ERUVS|nr:unnamed protein product [Eruca vesicaria subsp. sativa]
MLHMHYGCRGSREHARKIHHEEEEDNNVGSHIARSGPVPAFIEEAWPLMQDAEWCWGASESVHWEVSVWDRASDCLGRSAGLRKDIRDELNGVPGPLEVALVKRMAVQAIAVEE